MKIFYIQYENPQAYPPIEHSSRILAEKGWDVHHWGIQFKTITELRFPPHPRIHITLFKPFTAGWRQKVHYVSFLLRALFRYLMLRPDWVYVSNPLTCPIGLVLKKVFRARVIYHEHDTPEPQPQMLARFISWTRGKLGECADGVVFPHAGRSETLTQSLKKKPRGKFFVVFNCPSVKEVISSPKGVRTSPELRIITHGSLTHGRPPLAFFEAISGLPIHFDLVGYHSPYDPNYPEHLKKLMSVVKAPAKVIYHGALPRYEIASLLDKADVGVHLYSINKPNVNERYMAGPSVKVFEFLSRGLPVLISQYAEWEELAQKTPCLVTAKPDMASDIREKLLWFLSQPKEGAQLGENGRLRCLQDWNYEHQFQPVLDLLLSQG